MKLSRRQLTRIVLTILLVVGIAAALLRFIVDNTQRIAKQNEEYLNELTTQRAISVDSLIAENLTFIRSTAYLYGRSLTSPWADVAVIRDYEENSAFDRLRFVDASGDDYTSRGVMANLSDRDYFQAGMRGESGVTYVLNSRVTGEKQIGFYAPVYYEDEIIGIMVGFYGEDYVRRLLEYDLFGYEGEGWLCARDGAVIGATRAEAPENYLTHLREDGHCEGEALARVEAALVAGEEIAFTYTDGKDQATGYAVGLTQAEWVLIRSFPPSASKQILENANGEGEALIAELVVLFSIYVALFALDMVVEQRRTREANRNANDVSTGVSRLFDKFVTLDLTTEEYRYIIGTPDDPNLPPEGGYASFCRSLLDRMPDEKQRGETAAFIDPDNLKALLADADRASLRVHAPILDAEWLTYNFIVIERRAGAPTRVLVVCQDVTDLHRKEEAEQRQLQQALDAAEQANRAKTEFLFNMSHDIRTPMNAIMGFTGIAATHLQDGARVRDCLDKIDAAGKHLLSLINDVLDMSKIESGKLQLNVEDFSLSDAVGHLVDMVKPQAEAKRQALNLSVEIDHDRIQGDPLRLNQILLNILSNAVKYTPEEGRIDLAIRELDSGAAGRGLYEFRVRDNGIGMSPEYLPKLFENFTRERGSTVSKIQGTGLGMPIAKKLVEMMSGDIAVESALGAGTTFTVHIPADFASAPAQADGAADEALSPERLAGHRLLLAEDNAINAEIARFILTEAGFEVDWAENGSVALERVRADHDGYSAVLMDIQMPVMDGYAAASAIRAFEAEQGLARVPVIAMTANTFEDDRRNAFEAGMDAHIAKPYVQEEMVRTVTMYALYGCEGALARLGR